MQHLFIDVGVTVQPWLFTHMCAHVSWSTWIQVAVSIVQLCPATQWNMSSAFEIYLLMLVWLCDPGFSVPCGLLYLEQLGQQMFHWTVHQQRPKHVETICNCFGAYASCKWTSGRWFVTWKYHLENLFLWYHCNAEVYMVHLTNIHGAIEMFCN